MNLHHRKRYFTLCILFLIMSLMLVSCKNTDSKQNTPVDNKMNYEVKTEEPTVSVNPTDMQNTPVPTAATPEENHNSTPAQATSSPQNKPTPTKNPAVPSPKPNPSPKPQVKPKTAEQYVDTLTLEQQVAQMFFARCPDSGAVEQIKQYAPGGYILFARDFEDQTPSSIRKTIQGYQNASTVSMLIGVDEEGGTVVRVSKYAAFRNTPFSAPGELYANGGLTALTNDAREKDQLLKSLGINVNLAPVCDITTNPNDYIYKRTMRKDAKETAECIRAIVSQMQKDTMGTVLKHFPGYGSNVDTHTGIAIDNRSLDSFRQNDFLPFISGINAGAKGVMVNHNIINSIDATCPATLSAPVHSVLRKELKFNGVIMTDDLSMSAITKYTNGKNAAVSAVLAGNDMLISSDFVNQYQAVVSAVKSGTIDKSQIRASVIRIIQWKAELGLIRF